MDIPIPRLQNHRSTGSPRWTGLLSSHSERRAVRFSSSLRSSDRDGFDGASPIASSIRRAASRNGIFRKRMTRSTPEPAPHWLQKYVPSPCLLSHRKRSLPALQMGQGPCLLRRYRAFIPSVVRIPNHWPRVLSRSVGRGKYLGGGVMVTISPSPLRTRSDA